MKPLRFLFGVHNHQPLGNFPEIFEWAYERAYRPFVEIVHDYPEFAVTYHFSGPLLEFLVQRHPEFIEKVRSQVHRGQVEVVLSGYAEPVLAVLPREDRLLQLRKAQSLVLKTFGTSASGLWLTERVFESEILSELVEAGIRYFVVDDAHFLQVGVPKHDLHGFWVHPVGLQSIAVFPIDETLRYLIPFRPLDELWSYLQGVWEHGGEAAVVFDDGEKFGLWPKTYGWVYRKCWLRRFIERVLETPWLQPMTFGQFLETHAPLGTVFLPSASYFEMNEWALPPAAARRFVRVVQKLEKTKDWNEIQPFLRGGIWKNFLVKYAESARMYGRMLWTREWIREYTRLDCLNEDVAITHILRAQCNDAYWHGVFGGIYLPHLRHAIYRELIQATKIHWEQRFALYSENPPKIQGVDLDFDGSREYGRLGPYWTVIADEQGGVIEELSWWPATYNFQNTLSRYREHYHDLWLEDAPVPSDTTDGEGGVVSIHEFHKRIPKRARRELYFDSTPRVSFADHVFPRRVSLKALHQGRYPDLLLLRTTPYEVSWQGPSLVFTHRTEIQGQPFRIHKIFDVLSKDAFRAIYEVEGRLPRSAVFAVELNWIFPSATSGWLQAKNQRIPLHRRVILHEVSDLTFDDASGMVWRLFFGPADRVTVFPFYTVSQSEKGIDLIYQGHALFLMFSICEDPWRREIVLKIEAKEDTQDAGIAL